MNKFLSALLVVLTTLVITSYQSSANDYVVGPGDVLRITVFEHGNLSTVDRITENGFIVVPLLGEVKVGGLTVSKVSSNIASLLADGYLVNPMVRVFVEEFRSKSAVVLGHVNIPGLLELSGPTTLLQLLSKAGGLKEGSGDTATIKRKSNGDKKVILIDLVSLFEGGDLAKNISIHDGDTVFISKGGMCYVTGEVQAPGAYPCKDQPTVLKLIALAGGFTGKAAKSNVNIVRVVDGEKTILKNADLHQSLLTDDVIVVPEGFW
ncbi:MAG: SLBB domain-containing protein [Desulfocapsa sp.]|nr:SLBB domain-containing protein [Desulfocapsa sp.]